MNSFELQNIAVAGGGMIVDGRKYNAFELQNIAQKINSLLLVRYAQKFNAFECQNIAKANPGKVIFDFTEPTT